MGGFRQARLSSAVGEVCWITRDGVLKVLGFDPEGVNRYAAGHGWAIEGPDDSGVGERLRRWFAGDRAALDDLQVAPEGTAFQRAVWDFLRTIPSGSTLSYGQIARDIERPRAVRAVGAAVGANPIGIVIPCHRVIGADGSLTGYAGGLGRKRWLLDHERGGQLPLW